MRRFAIVCALTLALAAALLAPACTKQAAAAIPVSLLSITSYEQEANAVRGMLEEAGFEVTLNLVADYSTYATQESAHQYDIALMSWGTPAANADYAVRGLFHNDGEYNVYPIDDDTLAAMIDEAATYTYEESIPYYAAVEKRLVEEMTYMVPLYASTRSVSVYKSVIDENSIELGKGTGQYWATTKYVDAANSETRPFVFSQTQTSPPNFDPLRTNEGSTHTMKGNVNIQLVYMDTKDQIVTEHSLSHAYAVAEGNTTYYFILRDNVGFCKVENGQAVDTGVKVAAEDVLFTLKRAMDIDSVPTNRGSTFLSSVSGVSIVTDLSELESAAVSSTGESVLDYFNSQVPVAVSSLAATRGQVSNGAGAYQVVKIETSEAFPQLLNYLTHPTLGIVSEQAVTAVNEGIDANSYAADTDTLYGDISTLTKGSAQFDNQMWFSGPYALLYLDDYGVYFERNPVFMPGTDEVANIKNVTVRMISDATTNINALRSNETDFAAPTGINVKTCKEDPNLATITSSSNSVYHLTFNLSGNSVMGDINLRHAVLYAISQEDMILVKDGEAVKCGSTLTMIPTGNEWFQDLDKAKEYIQAYNDSQ